MKTGVHTVVIKFRTWILLRQPCLDTMPVIGNDESAVIGMAVGMGEDRRQPAVAAVIVDNT